MEQLKGKGLKVPEVTYIGKEYLIFGMQMAPGKGMPHPDYLPEDQQQALAKDLVNFVIEMAHALPQKGNKFAAHDDLWYANIMIDPVTSRSLQASSTSAKSPIKR